jgi:predicted deacylase
LSGSVVAVTGANPFGMMFGQYWNIIDWMDISGQHPGNATRYASQRLGKALWDAVEAVQPDYAYDMHCNPFDYPLTLPVNIAGTTYAQDNETAKRALEMAKASGLTVLTSRKGARPRSPQPRGLGSNCMSRGIPCMTSEFGWGRYPHGKHVDIAVRVLLNVMKWAGMLEGELEKHTEVPVLPTPPKYVSMPTVMTERGGLMEPTIKAGDFVKEGTTIAKIYNPHGELVEAVPLPFDGSIYSYFGGTRHSVTWQVTTGTNIAWTFAKEG